MTLPCFHAIMNSVRNVHGRMHLQGPNREHYDTSGQTFDEDNVRCMVVCLRACVRSCDARGCIVCECAAVYLVLCPVFLVGCFGKDDHIEHAATMLASSTNTQKSMCSKLKYNLHPSVHEHP